MRDVGFQWMAPELFYPVRIVKGEITSSRLSAETNVWALGMVIQVSTKPRVLVGPLECSSVHSRNCSLEPYLMQN